MVCNFSPIICVFFPLISPCYSFICELNQFMAMNYKGLNAAAA
ncbi:hypothetical protein WLH_05694 [Escherichia coli O25b:H4]|uniref:Uncharacterized protein n=1 Tax=Escherichia coli O25b:H4 TaxID=941280 RepID=A0A192CM30_ECO25|nr:hypothetical protein WLH_05694 [Escherichia coli O25b:H4]